MSGDLGENWGERTSSPGGPDASLVGRSSFWSVVLQTFVANSPGHEVRAAELVRRVAQLDPAFRRAFVHTDDLGSMALLGRHASADADQAQADLQFVKEFALQGQPLFPRAMLSRIRLERDPATIGPYELLSTRVQNPDIRDLYTFQVAAWGTFREFARRGERTMSWAEVRRAAEENVRELRSRGYQAYVHHDEDREMSMVTIGIFLRSAYDAQGQVYLDPQLERLAREFTVHLVNGQPLEIPQRPLLVEVPELP